MTIVKVTPPRERWVDENGHPTRAFFVFITSLFNNTTATVTAVSVSQSVGAMNTAQGIPQTDRPQASVIAQLAELTPDRVQQVDAAPMVLTAAIQRLTTDIETLKRRLADLEQAFVASPPKSSVTNRFQQGILVNGTVSISGQASTGANTATFTAANKPGSAATLTPQTWLTVKLDGTSYLIPGWI